MSAIYQRELRRYFSNTVGFVFIGFSLLVTGILTYLYCIYAGNAAFEHVVYYSSIPLALIVPIMAMSSFAEERHQKTDQLLYALPLRSAEVVAGKYFAMVTVFTIPTLFLCLLPLLLSAFGTLHLAVVYTTVLNYYLMGCALIAICMFLSSLTENTLVAALLGMGAMLIVYLTDLLVSLIPGTAVASYFAFTVTILLFTCLFWYMTHNTMVSCIAAILLEAGLSLVFLTSRQTLTAAFPHLIRALSLLDRLGNTAYGGFFDITTPVYYLSVAFLLCFFTVQSMEKRRWS